MNNKICILVYTHEKSKVCWKPFFGRLRKFASNFDFYVLCNSRSIEEFVSEKDVFIYNDKDAFTEQIISGIKQLNLERYEYIIYSQEDFILYDNVNEEFLEDATNAISSGYTQFVKLIKSGESEFCLQATLNSTTKLVKFFSEYKINIIWDEQKLSQMSIGKYESNYLPEEWVGFKRGLYHYDSKIWPYIATALNKGKWNWNEYPKEIKDVFDEYGIK